MNHFKCSFKIIGARLRIKHIVQLYKICSLVGCTLEYSISRMCAKKKSKMCAILMCMLHYFSSRRSVLLEWHCMSYYTFTPRSSFRVPFLQIQAECPHECSCPSSPPLCLPGISSVLDSCGCCRVCARQFNQDCSATEPCDHIKGLHCHLGAKGDPLRGLCRGEGAKPTRNWIIT